MVTVAPYFSGPPQYPYYQVAPPLPAAPQYVNYAQQAQQDAAYLRTVRGDGKPADPKIFRGDNEALPGMSKISDLIGTFVKPVTGASKPETQKDFESVMRYEELAGPSPLQQAPPLQMEQPALEFRDMTLSGAATALDLDLWNKWRGQTGWTSPPNSVYNTRNSLYSSQPAMQAYQSYPAQPVLYQSTSAPPLQAAPAPALLYTSQPAGATLYQSYSAPAAPQQAAPQPVAQSGVRLAPVSAVNYAPYPAPAPVAPQAPPQVVQSGATYTTYSSLPAPTAAAATAQAGQTYTMTVADVERLRQQQEAARLREQEEEMRNLQEQQAVMAIQSSMRPRQ